VSEIALDFLCKQYDLIVEGTGWRSVMPKPGSFFDENQGSGAAMKPDFIIGG